jgi:hypothetical protein
LKSFGIESAEKKQTLTISMPYKGCPFSKFLSLVSSCLCSVVLDIKEATQRLQKEEEDSISF